MAGGENKELATLYYGAELTRSATEDMIGRTILKLPHLEYEAVYGGQSLYPLLVSVD